MEQLAVTSVSLFELFLIADVSENLLPARLQMAFTLGFHIILACFGVGLPVLMLAAEWLWLRTGDELWRTLARRWSRAFLVMFAVGAVTGTVLSFELGLLWPEFMGRWGAVIGLPFTMEGFAFFLEAIFAGIYLYGWDRLPPRIHWLTGWPIAIAGFFSAFFVVMANAWMNTPAGFRIEDGQIVEIDPVAAMFNEAAGAQVAHMILAAYLVTGFGVAAFYAWRILASHSTASHPTDSQTIYNRRAMTLGLLLALPLAPVQALVGDWAAKMVARSQPVKFAAMEGHFVTQTRAPLHIGGVPDSQARETRYSIPVPGALSFLAHGDWTAEVVGLNDFPREDWPPVPIVHYSFQIMVAIGVLMIAVGLWAAIHWIRKRDWPPGKWFLRMVVLLGPLSVIALQTGWIVTEVGRQPWIVQGYMRTHEAVTESPGVWNVFYVTLVVYFLIGLVTVALLVRMSRIPFEPDGSKMQEQSHGS